MSEAKKEAKRRAAERMRRSRRRKAAGLIRIAFDADEVELVEMLHAGGYLDSPHTEDREQIGAAVTRLLQSLQIADIRRHV